MLIIIIIKKLKYEEYILFITILLKFDIIKNYYLK